MSNDKEAKNMSLLGEVFCYIKKEKKYWLIPMIVVFIFFGLLLVVAEVFPLVSPFIYTLF